MYYPYKEERLAHHEVTEEWQLTWRQPRLPRADARAGLGAAVGCSEQQVQPNPVGHRDCARFAITVMWSVRRVAQPSGLVVLFSFDTMHIR